MKKTFLMWSEILTSPSRGFSSMNEKSPVVVALVIILVLVICGAALLLPMLSSDSYSDALMRVQVNTLKERGSDLSDEQIEAMQQQMQSGKIQKITIITSIAGAAFGYFIMLLISALILKLILLIFREKASFKLLLRILVFIGLISAVQIIVKNIITVTADYERVLSQVQSSKDLQYAITSPVSLAAIFQAGNINPVLYFLTDTVTDIFNWIYYGYLYAGLRWAVNLEHKKSLIVTIVIAVIIIAVGAIFSLVF